MILSILGGIGAWICYTLARRRSFHGRRVAALAATGLACSVIAAFSCFYLVAVWIKYL